MKNILVTGSNGFIGKYLHNTIKLSTYNIIYGTTSYIEKDEYLTFSDLYENIEEILCDTDIDTIIHLASIIPKSFNESDSKLFFDNIKMMINLSEYATNKKISKFIYLSSFGSMEFPKKYDIKDYYTLSKITGEHICSMLESKGVETASLRISSPFGEFYNSINVLSIFIDLALQNKTINVYGTGNRKQNFIYAGNIIECINKCLNNKISGNYDLVSKENISMKDLAKLVVKLTNSKSDIRIGLFEDVLEKAVLPNFSLTRLEKELRYNETYSFEDALISYIQWRKSLIV